MDGDGVCDGDDACPNDPLKVVPGACGCGVPANDSDNDGICDDVDDDIDECVDVLQTTGTLSGTELYEAVIRVESDAIINPPAQIDFSAGQEILLKPGFEVKDNAVLHAYILGCSN